MFSLKILFEHLSHILVSQGCHMWTLVKIGYKCLQSNIQLLLFWLMGWLFPCCHYFFLASSYSLSLWTCRGVFFYLWFLYIREIPPPPQVYSLFWTEQKTTEEPCQALFILPGNKNYTHPVDRPLFPVPIIDTFNTCRISESKEWFLFVLQFANEHTF